MTNLELVFNMLAEASTTEISKEKQPQNFKENVKVAKEGGKVANVARKQLERTSGKKVISNKNTRSIKSTNNKKIG